MTSSTDAHSEAIALAKSILKDHKVFPMKWPENVRMLAKALVATTPTTQPSSEPVAWRYCQFCGCHTNARIRACCEKGHADDCASHQPSSDALAKSMTGPIPNASTCEVQSERAHSLVGENAEAAGDGSRKVGTFDSSPGRPTPPSSEPVAWPADTCLANAPYGPGKRIVGIVIDEDKFGYLHEASDWLRSMLYASPQPSSDAREVARTCHRCGTSWDAPVEACPSCGEERFPFAKDEATVLLTIKAYLTGAYNVDRVSVPEERAGRALQRIEARLDYLARQSTIPQSEEKKL